MIDLSLQLVLEAGGMLVEWLMLYLSAVAFSTGRKWGDEEMASAGVALFITWVVIYL